MKRVVLQLVDFHEFAGFLWWPSWGSAAVLLQFLIVQNPLMQVIDFQDNFNISVVPRRCSLAGKRLRFSLGLRYGTP